MTVTRDPAGGTPPEGGVDDTELAALEAAEAQARGNARRAAQALRAARRARAEAGSAEVAAAEIAAVDAETTRVPLTKRVTTATPADSEKAATATKAPPADAAAVDEHEADDDLAVDDDLDTDDPDTDDEPADDADEATDRPRRARPRRVTLIALVAVVLAAVFVVISAFVYSNAQDTRGSSPAAARDAALLAARQDVVVLNTLDYTDIDGGLQRWLAATTGDLNSRLSTVSAADRQAIATAKTKTTASVLAAAVTQVDSDKGTASVMASVQVQVQPATGDATTKRIRFTLAMNKVAGTWKISEIAQLGVKVT